MSVISAYEISFFDLFLISWSVFSYRREIVALNHRLFLQLPRKLPLSILRGAMIALNPAGSEQDN